MRITNRNPNNLLHIFSRFSRTRIKKLHNRNKVGGKDHGLQVHCLSLKKEFNNPKASGKQLGWKIIV